MKLHDLRNVVAVAERGSLHAAARHLKIAQPALTRSIHELERELGVVLFQRGAKGTVVTETGERFLQRARAVVHELGLMREELGQLQGSTQGHISICLGVLPHLTLLPYALSAFRVRYPEVHLDIIEGRFPSVEGSLKSGIMDFFVGPLPDAPGREFIVERLYDQDVAVLCRKGHPLAGSRSLHDLVDAEWLTNSITFEPSDELGPLFARHGLPAPRLVAQSHSALTVLTVVAYSDLLVMIPADLARSALGSVLLQRIAIAEALPNHAIAMIRRAALPLTPAAEYFADMFRRASTQHAHSRELKSEPHRGDAATPQRKLAASSVLPRP